MNLNLLIKFQEFIIANRGEIDLICQIELKLSILFQDQNFACDQFFNNLDCNGFSYTSMHIVQDID